MAGRFEAAGYETVPFGTPCDVTVIHGCVITGKAEHSSLYAARQARRIRPDTLVILAGCPAETLGEALRGDTTVDLTIGHAGKFAIPDLLHRLHPHRFPVPADSGATDSTPRFDTQRALIKVQDGCDFHCAYCIVPTARGVPRSRPIIEVLDEVRRVTAAGFREIILTGANLGRYEDGPRRLADLVRDVESLPSVARIRLSSLEITTAEQAIIEHMANSPKLCQFLHIPLQSGDDGILAAMGRRYDTDTFRRTVAMAVEKIPFLGLGTDIIVGFPGEDDRAFENTVQLVRDLPFSNLHVFPYSRRSGTRADALPGQVRESVKKERLHTLVEIGDAKRRLFAERFVGRSVSVLVERVDAEGMGHGWTGEYLEATVTGDSLSPRQIVTMKVEEVEFKEGVRVRGSGDQCLRPFRRGA
jgi:threonylcarbamoyladenosine tRNA methylthiotransferase MtaB